MDTNGTLSTLLVALVNIVLFGAVIWFIVRRIRRQRHADTTLDPAFQGYPVGTGTVLDRAYQYRRIYGRSLYRITYLVRTHDGQEFQGWEDAYVVPFGGKERFAVGTTHRIAYRPGSTEVRAVP